MTPDEEALPSERFLARMNGVVDTDVTLLVRSARREELTHALRAAAGSLAAVGRRARQHETRRRDVDTLGPLHVGPAARVGPIDIAAVDGDPSLVVLRWSHLAGDARTLQEFVLDAADAAGLGVAAGCRCVRFEAGRPVTAADAWRALRIAGRVRARDASRAALPSVGPALRRSGLAGGFQAPPGDDGNDAVVALRLPATASQHGASWFAAVAAVVGGMIGGGAGGRARVGITVDVRRHERLPLEGSAGNLSLVGWIDIPPGRDGAIAAHRAVQRLLHRRFWLQQLASDAWLARAPVAVVEAVSTLVLDRLAALSPVTVTELWRDDASSCERCGQPRRRAPDGLEVLAIPPAQPPAGLTCGVTRSGDDVVVVLRRVTPAGQSAMAWLDATSTDVVGDRVIAGPIRWVNPDRGRGAGSPVGPPPHRPPSSPLPRP